MSESSGSTDSNLIGVIAARAMERVDELEAEVRSVMLAIELDSEDHTTIAVFSHDDRSWVQLAFIDEVRIMLERQMEQAGRTVEDE